MEPMEGPQQATIPTAGAPPRSRSKLKAALASVAVVGMLTTWGVASVFAASPTASASSSATASDDASDDSSGDAMDRVCPDDANGSDSSSDSSSDATSS
jgi:cytoskeletal protein RodZ